MNRKEVIELLRDEYSPPVVSAQRVRNLAEMTKHVPVDILEAAAKEYMKTGQFFPRVSQFLAVIDAVIAAGAVERRQQRDVDRYGRFRADHTPINDEARLAAEQGLGLMRETAVIEAEIATARLRFDGDYMRFTNLQAAHS